MVHNVGETTMTLIKSIFASPDRMLGCLCSGIISLFAPIYVAILSVFFFIIVDWIYGYKVSRKYKRRKIESSKIWKTINKMTEAVMLIVGAHIVDEFVVVSLNLHAVEFIAGIICFTEFWSILESLSELHPKGPWKLFRKVIKAKGEKYLEVDITDKDLQNL